MSTAARKLQRKQILRPMTTGRLPRLRLLLVLLLSIPLPVAGLLILRMTAPQEAVSFVFYLHRVLSVFYLLVGSFIILEAAPVFAARRRPTAPVAELPPVTVLIPAYLPNEQDIILNTLHYVLSRLHVPQDKLQVILAYNTPHSLPVEAALRRLAAGRPNLTVLRVPASRSKADNINAALPLVTGEVTLLLDADGSPEPDCFRKAWQDLSRGYDAVQGNCVVRNWQRNRMTRMVAVEYSYMYNVLHAGRFLLSGQGIFGGSNGYWRTAVLKQLGMNGAAMTEDIDISVRAVLAGYRLYHDPDIVATELAPVRFRHWWRQRTRWAQGWFQVTYRYQLPLWLSRKVPLSAKLHWTYTLLMGQIFPLMSMVLLSVFPASLLLGIPVPTDWLSIVSTAVIVSTGPLVALAAYLRAPAAQRGRLSAWYLVYGLLCWLWAIFQNLIALLGMANELMGSREWSVTPRGVGAQVSTFPAHPNRPRFEQSEATSASG